MIINRNQSQKVKAKLSYIIVDRFIIGNYRV